MTTSTAKVNMIKQQIHILGNLDPTITDVLLKVSREEFVPETMKAFAYTDMEVSLGYGEKMFTPRVEAQILNAIKAQKSDNVLEIGTGSGYFTALLAMLTDSVTTVDIHEDFVKKAKYRLKALNIYNVKYHHGNAAQGWEPTKKYDLIVINGALPLLPENFKKQLTENGRLFCILGTGDTMEGILIKKEKDQWTQKSLFDTSVVPLKEAVQPEKFVF